ncbi:hypothetical protein TWF730_002020 [Orbilia blumenaviensis]|uniref:Uncharacterized protein n=1 Tax=Orbilia blumenaviensis TaxID=1796055 RepID=A0AAV9UGS8_9PEZI
MASGLYLSAPLVQEAITQVQSYKRFLVGSLWNRILAHELPREEGWFLALTRPYNLPYWIIPMRHEQGRWRSRLGVPGNRDNILGITWAHDFYEFGRHRKFWDDAKEAILQVMTLYPHDEISDYHVTIAAASEFTVEFWEWTGRQLGRPVLRKLVVQDNIEGGEISGPLHIIDDAEKVHQMIKYAKERIESNGDPSRAQPDQEGSVH